MVFDDPRLDEGDRGAHGWQQETMTKDEFMNDEGMSKPEGLKPEEWAKRSISSLGLRSSFVIRIYSFVIRRVHLAPLGTSSMTAVPG